MTGPCIHTRFRLLQLRISMLLFVCLFVSSLTRLDDEGRRGACADSDLWVGAD